MSDEKVIGSWKTALALGDEFFCGQEHAVEDDLIPVIYSLTAQMDGFIKESGIYSFELCVKKIK